MCDGISKSTIADKIYCILLHDVNVSVDSSMSIDGGVQVGLTKRYLLQWEKEILM